MWNKITEIDWEGKWPNNDGYAVAKQMLLDTYTEQECREFTEFVTECHVALSEQVRSYECRHKLTCGKYIGLDSFNDMIAQVIGLGEQKFNAVFANPMILGSVEFGESFMYCLPHDEDFKLRSQTKECVTELKRIIKETDDNNIALDLIKRCRLILKGNFKQATNNFNGNVYDNMRFFTGNDQSAKFANLIRDCNKYHVSY